MFYDRDFLLELDKQKNKIIYARVIALTFEETPIETIEGRVTQGSINLDGASAVRRSCSLTLVAQEFDYSDYLWGLNTKFKLEIGVQNMINPNYPEIIWFPQGIYLISSFNTARGTNNFTITIQGKDKMCLLNGEVGGTIGVQTDFGTIEEEDADGVWTIRPIPIPEIIRNMVHTQGGEPYHNIIIKDLNTYGLELLEYRYENMPLVLYRLNESKLYKNMLFLDSDIPFYETKANATNKEKPVYLHKMSDLDFDVLIDNGTRDVNGKIFYTGTGEKIQFLKINYGDTAGYRQTDLTYAGELIANVGESVTSVLDKIKDMLVEFEYFYDVEGHFVFQKKQSFVNTLWTPTDTAEGEGNEEIKESLVLSSSNAYTFTAGELIISFNNNPNLLNLRNDFSIWGERTGVSGAKIPIHLRYAIDVKPKRYTTITLQNSDKEEIKEYNDKYGTTLKDTQESQTYGCEYIYKKVQKDEQYHSEYDYFKGPNKTPCTFTSNKDFLDAVQEGFDWFEEQDSKDKLIYWDYKIDIMVGDWREILYLMATDYFKYNTLDNFEIRIREANPNLYPTGRTGYEQYYTDIQVCWRQLYDNTLLEKINTYKSEKETLLSEIEVLKNELLDLEKDIVLTNNAISQATNQDTVDILYQNLITYSNRYSTAKYNYNDVQQKLENKQSQLDRCLNSIENYYYMIELGEKEAYNKNYTYYIPSEDYALYTYSTNSQFILDRDAKKIVRFIGTEEPRCYWCRDVYENPGVLNYWFDFLDSEGELSNFTVRAIGARTKAINETTVKSIYFRETPDIIFEESAVSGSNQQRLRAYRYIQIPQLENMFTISAQGKSAKERLDELLYAHAYCSEAATINAIPIYYLQPNTRVHISDPETKLEGDYIVSKITIPLGHNGNMSLTTTKAAETVFL